MSAQAYPERDEALPSSADRFFATLAWRWQLAFARQLRPEPLPELLQGASAGLDKDIAKLRYAVRRDGFTSEVTTQALAAACAALGSAASAQVVAAARVLVRGGLVEVAQADARRQAVALAALARAMSGAPVHWLAPTERQARGAEALLRPALERLGLDSGAVRCATVREIAFDYLRDRLQLGPRVRPLRGLIERLSGDGIAPGRLRLAGLHCALVEEADEVMLDEAHAPLVITAEPDLAGDRLLLDQARELAQALSAEGDFIAEAEGVRLTGEGSRRLAQLCVLLGAPWNLPARREELVVAALGALHLGREANRGSDVLLRLSLPRFLNRYLHLAGACRDARGIEGEFWSLYSLRTSRAGPAAPPLPFTVRMFRDTALRRAALLEILRHARGARVAIRTKGEADALRALGVPDGALVVFPAHRQAAADADPNANGGTTLLVGELHELRHVAQIARASGAPRAEVLLALEDEAVRAALGALADGASRLYQDELPFKAAQTLGRRALAGAQREQAGVRKEIVVRERQLDELLAFSGTS